MVNLMVNYSLDATFAALADPTRRAILARLSLGETSVSELAEPFAMSLPAVLKHVGALEGAGLLEARKDGRVRRCRLEAGPLLAASHWIAGYREFWEERFDALDRYLRETGGQEETWRKLKPGRAVRSGSRAPSRRRGKGSSAPSRKRRR
jgi:DNA-binding transcriptional ArsR family regulator